MFSSFKEIPPKSVQMRDKSTAVVTGERSVSLQIMVGNNVMTCNLEKVLYVPSLSYSLISVGAITQRDLTFTFEKMKVVSICRSGIVYAEGSREGTLYKLDTIETSSPASLVACVAGLQTRHSRLGHVHNSSIKNMIANNSVLDLEVSHIESDHV